MIGDIRERLARLETEQWHTRERLGEGTHWMRGIAQHQHQQDLAIRSLQDSDRETSRMLSKLEPLIGAMERLKSQQSRINVAGWIGAALLVGMAAAGKIPWSIVANVIAKQLGG